MARYTPRRAFQDKSWAIAFIFVFPPVATLTGCSNSCFVFVSNPGGGTSGIAVSNSTGCPVAAPHAAVHAAVHVPGLCESCSESNQIRSIFVTLRGIALHLTVNGGERPSEWQELFPSLEWQPRQFDLMKASPHGFGGNLIGDRAIVPAGAYDLVRMRFVPHQGSSEDTPAAENACGRLGWNCVMMGDGRIVPLVLRDGSWELRIASENVEHGFLLLPDSENQLTIDLAPVWLAVTAPGEEAGLLPVLTARGRRLSENQPQRSGTSADWTERAARP